MIHNPIERGGAWTASDDPRITRFGATLRRYKFDELPQLINVVRGEMSLVGPRPEVMDEVLRYSDEEKQLLMLRPGITDWASAKFCQEGDILQNAQDPVSYYDHHIRPEKVRLGLEYARNNSLWIDVRIIFHTLARLVREERAIVSRM
jgi:lipopolysaccharide/colanic/teichoic acid biosynthesis glycosyltransferase